MMKFCTLKNPRSSVIQKSTLPDGMARRGWIFDSSSDACEDEEGSTSLTPESAGLGGKEPEKQYESGVMKNIDVFLFSTHHVWPEYVKKELG